MAMTAWETYVEDRLLEAATERLDASIAAFVQGKLADEIRRLHNPTSVKTLQLFRDYAGVDLADKWRWNIYNEKLIRDRLEPVHQAAW